MALACFQQKVTKYTYSKGSLGVNGPQISHIQFADDTLIFCEANSNQLRGIKRILRCFKVTSRLKINFNESEVVGYGVEIEKVKEWDASINCSYSNLHYTYFGFPLGANPNRITTWQGVIRKIKNKLMG